MGKENRFGWIVFGLYLVVGCLCFIASGLLIYDMLFAQSPSEYCEDKGFDYSRYYSEDHPKVESGYIRCCKEKADSKHELIETCKIIKDERDPSHFNWDYN
jgi:hypothetical protein